MIRGLLFSLLLTPWCCTSKAPADTTKTVEEELTAEDLEKKALEIYQDDPLKAANIFAEAAEKYRSEKDLAKAAISNLNTANILDEHLNKPEEALVYSNKSLQQWKELNDTLQIANLLKYIGLLEGRTGNTERAKVVIEEAIKLYEEQGFEQGRAVSQINLADVYFREQDYGRSEKLFLEAKTFWLQKGDQGRVFSNNLLGVEIYEQLKKEDEKAELIKENMEIAREINVAPYNLKRFEELIEEE